MKRGGNKNETTAILTPKKTVGSILQESLESPLQLIMMMNAVKIDLSKS